MHHREKFVNERIINKGIGIITPELATDIFDVIFAVESVIFLKNKYSYLKNYEPKPKTLILRSEMKNFNLRKIIDFEQISNSIKGMKFFKLYSLFDGKFNKREYKYVVDYFLKPDEPVVEFPENSKKTSKKKSKKKKAKDDKSKEEKALEMKIRDQFLESKDHKYSTKIFQKIKSKENRMVFDKSLLYYFTMIYAILLYFERNKKEYEPYKEII